MTFQAFLFVDQFSLAGSRKHIYTLLKMMKYFTDAPVTSYKLKFAVHSTFHNKEPAADDLGNSLLKVMEHKEIRGSFGSVRKELKELGVEKIILHPDRVDFIGRINFELFYII